MNKVILMGNLGKDPELKTYGDNKQLVKLSVATKGWSKDKKEDNTDWHNVTFFGKSAEAINKYFTKGRRIIVEGSLHYSTFEKKDGSKGHRTDIKGSAFHFVGSKKDESSNVPDVKAEKYDLANESITVDDIPF